VGNNVVVKVPMTAEGMKAVKKLSGEHIKTNVTLVFQPLQALIAAKAGADYVSPFVGRLDDISSAGMEMVEQIISIYGNYGFETEIIVASVRNPVHVLHAAMMGADVATIPFGVLKQLMAHPLTDIGIDRFLKDYSTLQK
jgi:transaldolase